MEDRRQLLLQHVQNSPPRAGKLLLKTGLWTVLSPDAIADAAERIAVFRIESRLQAAKRRRGLLLFSISASNTTTSTWVVLRCLSEMCL